MASWTLLISAPALRTASALAVAGSGKASRASRLGMTTAISSAASPASSNRSRRRRGHGARRSGMRDSSSSSASRSRMRACWNAASGLDGGVACRASALLSSNVGQAASSARSSQLWS